MSSGWKDVKNHLANTHDKLVEIPLFPLDDFATRLPRRQLVGVVPTSSRHTMQQAPISERLTERLVELKLGKIKRCRDLINSRRLQDRARTLQRSDRLGL